MGTSDPAFKYVELDGGPGGIAILRLARPQAMNALHLPAVREIRRALSAVARDESAKVLVIVGKGRAFCAGADLSGGGFSGQRQGLGGPEAGSADNGNDMEREWNPMIEALRAFPKPTISVVNGPAAGGGVGVALAADVTVAARSTYFVLTFTPTLGLSPDLGVTWQLSRRLGRGRALPLALLGSRLYADEAQRCDLIWEACDDDALWARGLELASRLAALPPQAVRLVREAVDAGASNSMSAQLRMEMEAQQQLFRDPDSLRLMAERGRRFREAAERRRARL